MKRLRLDEDFWQLQHARGSDDEPSNQCTWNKCWAQREFEWWAIRRASCWRIHFVQFLRWAAFWYRSAFSGVFLIGANRSTDGLKEPTNWDYQWITTLKQTVIALKCVEYPTTWCGRVAVTELRQKAMRKKWNKGNRFPCSIHCGNSDCDAAIVCQWIERRSDRNETMMKWNETK